MKKLLTILLLFLSISTLGIAQTRQVSGVVTAQEDGLALPGVSVRVPGTNTGTTTNSEGRFSLNVPTEVNTLQFSFIGFTSQTASIPASNVLNVVLVTDARQLGEVVVTALGISRQTKSLGYAISEVDGEALTRSGEANVIQGLASKAAGVQVTSSAGTPGASSKVVLRGASTFTGETQPLIVVDGVPIDNSTTTSVGRDYPFNANLQGVNNSNRGLDINPEDIESVSILKGPAAAALYGARAGNGAIVYTTKRGKQGKGLGIVFGYKTEIAEISNLPKLQTTYAQGASSTTYTTADPGPDLMYNTGDDISGGTSANWGPAISSLSGVQAYDNPSNFFDNSLSHNFNLSMNGGGEKVTYRLSAENLDQKGIVPNTDFDRSSIRLTTDAFLKDFLKVGGSANYVKSGGTKSQNGSNIGGIMLGLLRAPASFDLRQFKFEENGFQRTYFALYDNPYFTAYENPFTDDVNRITGNIFLSYIGKPWFNVTLKTGLDAYSDRRRQVYALSSFGNDSGDQTGQVNFDNITNNQIYTDLIFTGNAKLLPSVGFNYTAGGNITTRKFNQNFSRGYNLSVPGFYDLTNASDLYASSFAENQYTSALFGQLDFDFRDMLYLSLTGRNEWSSTFGESKNNFFYPSASLSWVFSELVQPDWLSFGKLRYAYSQAGISPEPYNTKTFFTKPTITDGFTNGVTFPFGGVNGFGYAESLGSPDLKPETVTGNEVGLNLKFLQNRLNFDLTLYKQKTKDILLFRPIAPSSGFIDDYGNSGELENKGIELELGGDIIQNENFSWNLSGNWSTNKSEVLKLGEGVAEINLEEGFASFGSYAIVGQPLGSFYGQKWQRNPQGQIIINSSGIPLKEATTGNIGDPNPDWLAGIRNTFTYKGIRLTGQLDIRQGGDIWNGTLARLHNIGKSLESADRERTYVVPGVLEDGVTPNTIAIPAIQYFKTYLGDAGGAEEQHVETVNWVRLRELSLSYRLKLPSLNKYIDYIDLSATGRNLWLDTNYKGVDPETSLTGAGSNINGWDYFNNPGTKSYLFGITVGF